jgi:predicted amino acid dehydrogenase
MQGYLISSCLLNHERLRMNPSLSNNYTLRIQPSIFFSMFQTEELVAGLKRFCEAAKNDDVTYFLSALYPKEEIIHKRTRDFKVNPGLGKRPLSVFLCHMINENHIKRVTKSLKNLPNQKLVEKLELTKDIAEFEIYHHQTLTDLQGREMDIIMMGVPLTSEQLKSLFNSSDKKYQVVQKIQNAIDYAKELGASTVGLGQFTSIVSGNGLYLDPRGMNLTTGNAYTIALTIQAALRSATEKNMNLTESTVALIGAAGNIMSVATSIMADKVGKVLLLHHSEIESSIKYQEAVRRILNEILQSKAQSKVVNVVKAHWRADGDLLSFLNHPEVAQVFVASSELPMMKEADIVLAGTNSSSSFLTIDLFKRNAVVVDIAVPPSIGPDLLARLNSERPDITYHLGGIAQVPNQETIDLFLLPLDKNQSFACMAETFSIGFSGKKNFLNIGDLNKNIVLEVEKIAAEVGFTLGQTKHISSL